MYKWYVKIEIVTNYYPCKGLEVRSLLARSSCLFGVCSTGWTNLDDPAKEAGNINIDQQKRWTNLHKC